MRKKILYITDGYVESTVFFSQVHAVCNHHSIENDVTLIALCTPSELNSNPPSDSAYNLIRVLRNRYFLEPLYLHISANRFIKNHPIDLTSFDVFHCRGHLGAGFGIALKKRLNLQTPLISDIRGLFIEETLLRWSQIRFLLLMSLKRLERQVFRESDGFFFVSKNMVEHFNTKYRINKAFKIIPTVVDENVFFSSDTLRKEMRTQLGLVDKTVFVYVGGTQSYQRLDEIVDAFIQHHGTNDQFFLLFVVHDPGYIHKLMQRYTPVPTNTKAIQAEHSDVPKYLNASDFGLLIRDDSTINQVASPTKFNEYLACGLKVIQTLDAIKHMTYTEHPAPISFLHSMQAHIQLIDQLIAAKH